MQNIVFYVAASTMLGTVKDYVNNKTAQPPSLVKGVGCTLKMRLFKTADGETPYPIEQFANVAAWSWIMDSDFNESTTHKLQADTGQITVATVTDEIDGDEHTYTEFTLPISNMATQELYTWLGTDEAKSGLHGELVGVDGDANTVFVLQVKNFTVRNRIGATGTPTEIEPEYLTEAQVRALVQGGFECQYSADGENWHATQGTGDNMFRFRIAGDDAADWSVAIILPAGTPGRDGHDHYCYVAYASDNEGTGFSLTPSNSLKYKAEIHVDEPIAEPALADFVAAGAVWVKHLGDDGQGAGDMKKADYDTDNDGKVDAAEHADAADEAEAVPWTGITGKPEPTRGFYIADTNGNILYTKHNVIRNANLASGASLALDFRSILDTPGGNAVTCADGDMFTWEYHVYAETRLTNITVGSAQSTMAGVNIPAELPLVNNNYTWHVFTVRGMYKASAVNKLALVVNYAYGYEA